jgi:hypothetical protein
MLILLIAIGCNTDNCDVVARISNQPITKSELKHWMLLEKSNVYSYFYRKYSVGDSDKFWIHKLGDEIPLVKLKETALEQVKRCKVQQMLALEKGIIETANFDEILEVLEAVNDEREQKVENGEPIYGPIQFTSRTYFSHVFDKMVIELKNELAKKELKPNKEELMKMQKGKGPNSRDNTGFLIMQYVDNNYDRYIDRLMDSAVVKVNKDVYKRICLE